MKLVPACFYGLRLSFPPEGIIIEAPIEVIAHHGGDVVSIDD